MSSNLYFLAAFTYIAVTLVFHCKAECPPPPTMLTHEWLDPFTVNVSWKTPRGLLDSSKVNYKYCIRKKDVFMSTACVVGRNFTVTCLTEEMDSDPWTYIVWTDGSQSCSNEGVHTNITSKNRKPRAEVVKDFICVIHRNETDCSWIPVDRSQILKLSYRICGLFEERIKGLKDCNQIYSSGTRNGCHLQVDAKKGDICILVETEAGMSTFKPELKILSPKLSVKEQGNKLKLSWQSLEIGEKSVWIYEVCYSRCSNPEECQNYTLSKEPTIELTYDNRCLYKIRSRVKPDIYIKKILPSDFSEVVTYGTNMPPDRTLTMVAIIIPIVLSICVLLSCYCFRRHSAIICPNIPDPSAIFKEMMMNGNKELKTPSDSLYTPVPEPIEQCRITPITENSILQQNI